MSATSRFEIIGELYHNRHGRLRPGKSDMFQDSSDEENRAQFDSFMATHCFMDAIDEIEKLQKRVSELELEIEDAQYNENL